MSDRFPPSEPVAALEWMNTRYATIVDSGKMFVVCRRMDSARERIVTDFTPIEHFRTSFFMGQYVLIPDPDGFPQPRPLTSFWLRHRDHRHLPGGVIFDPTDAVNPEDYLNLWSGFLPLALQQQCDTPDARWNELKHHIYAVICDGDEDHYEYVVDWMALGVQYPDRPAGVALVLRGSEGIGKGLFARTYGRLFGAHWLHLNDARQLIGTFNDHLEDSIVVFADEAIGTSDKAAVSKLKTLITEPTIQIEAKYRKAHTAVNHIRVILASNEHWVVPAGKDARRYCVLDVADHRRDDREYFATVTRQMEHQGGYGAMLTELMQRDLSDFDVFTIPKTEALLSQKLHTLSDNESWWLERLKEGRIVPTHEDWQQVLSRREARETYQAAMKLTALDRREVVRAATNLYHLLDAVLPAGFPKDGGTPLGQRSWLIPDLIDCRRHFESLVGQSIDWDWS